MASTIKVNNFQSQCGSCGTITIGGSGDTVSLGAGASQTGFGRTGTVNWDTTAKTAAFTAVSGNGYFVNTTSGAITMTLPASPSAGDIVAFKDYAGTFGTNNLTIGRNGSNLDGNAGDKAIDTGNTSMSLVYVDATQGWKSVEEGTGFIGNNFISATGGTETTCGDYKIHTFTGPGTFCVSNAGSPSGSTTVDYLVIAGGAGGGTYRAGAGGAGGYRFSDGTASGCYTAGPAPLGASALPVSITAYPITVGAGGAASSTPSPGNGDNGSNSIFSTITSAGGGGGGTYGNPSGTDGTAGGSGGGAGATECGAASSSGGAGNTPSVSPPQGNSGGNITPSGTGGGSSGGGGGGAGAVGGPSTTSNQTGGTGGAGLTSCITASPVARGGGGGGGATLTSGPASSGGGAGGYSTTPGVDGTANTGGGGGGAGNSAFNGGDGGSGIVIIRYKYQ